MTQYLKLPKYVKPCYSCHGEGEYRQMYNAGCGGGYYHSTGDCEHCRLEGRDWGKGQGYVYIWNEKWKDGGIPDTVLDQIKRMNPQPLEIEEEDEY